MAKRQPHRPEKRRSSISAPLTLFPLAVLSLSGWGPFAEEPRGAEDLAVVEDEPFVFQPSVVGEMIFAVPESTVGWGSLDLSAVPEHDDIRVDLLIGRPAKTARWRACDSVTLVVDGRRTGAAAEYTGVPMASGAWDALTAHVTIADVRDMYRATEVEAHVCGEVFPLPASERRSLAAFVRRFDDIALSIGPSMPTPLPELGDEHEWLPPQHDTTPSPA